MQAGERPPRREPCARAAERSGRSSSRAARRRRGPRRVLRRASAVASGGPTSIPLARPVLGEAEEHAVLEVLRSGQLSLGPARARVRARASPRASARAAGERGVAAAPPGCTSRCARSACGEGDEVVTSPFSFVASANAALYERARPVFADIDPRHAEPRPRRPPPRRSTERTRALLPVHIFGYPADMPGLRAPRAAATAWRSSRTRARRSARVHADGVAVGGRGHPAVFGFYANKQLTTGEGGMVTLGDAALKAADRLRAKPGPRARHGLARPRPARLQLPPLGHRLRARPRAARAPRRDARRARARRRALPRGARGRRGARAAVRGRAAATRAAGSCSSCSCPRGVDRDETVRALARARRSRASPTCRRST